MRRATRRQVLQGGLIAAATGLLPGCRSTALGPATETLPGFLPGENLPWRNWGGNQGCRPQHRAAPAHEEALAQLLREGTGEVRPVGTGHSFSPLVPSDGTLVACDLMSGVIEANSEQLQTEVWAGTRLHQLGPALQSHGQAMPNLPDIDYQTLGGAVATSTHGTGLSFGSLSRDVVGLTLITPAGDLIYCSEEEQPEVFHAARCSLGSLGVVSRMNLQNREPFDLNESTFFEPLAPLLEDIEARRAQHPYFEFYAFPHTEAAMILATDNGLRESTPEPEFEGDPLEIMRDIYAKVGWVPLLGSRIYESLIMEMANAPTAVRSGPSYQVLTHPRITRFREMEYSVPAEAGPACLREILDTIKRQAIPVVFPLEIRYVGKDDIWLSMFEGRDSCSISVHQFVDTDYRPYFDALEPIFWKYEGRPHWGKLHQLGEAELAKLYPHWQDFQEVRRGLDPTGRMLNPHLRNVFGETG